MNNPIITEHKWQPASTAPTDGTAVDLWVPDDSFEGGGQRFTDMQYVKGGARQRNDWDCKDGMLSLSDCGYSVEDVSHWMPIPAAPPMDDVEF